MNRASGYCYHKSCSGEKEIDLFYLVCESYEIVRIIQPLLNNFRHNAN